MNYKIVIILTLLFATLQGFGQQKYSNYQQFYARTVFFDAFDNNNKGWAIKSESNRHYKIENGSMILDCKDFASEKYPLQFFWYGLQLAKDDQYIFESIIQQHPDYFNEKTEYGVILRNDNTTLVYVLKGDREYKVYKFDQNGYACVIDYTTSSSIKFKEKNKLSIIKDGNYVLFFINETYVNKYKWTEVPKYIGYMIEQKTYLISDEISLKVYDKTEGEVSEPISQKQNKQVIISDVDENIPASNVNREQTFAVVIGNEDYNKEIEVEFARKDAATFRNYLEKTIGLPKSNIQYIENGTYGEILDALSWINTISKVFNGNAKLIFYYAGHGMPDEKSKSAYLLPVDGNSQNPMTAIKLEDLYNKLTEHPSQSIVVFLDACFSGSARDKSGEMLAKGRGVKIKPKEEPVPQNMVVISAATGDQTAFPYKEKGHGMFTYFLLKKIQETKGNVDLKQLSEYVITKVSQKSIVINKKVQTPQINAGQQLKSNLESIEF